MLAIVEFLQGLPLNEVFAAEYYDDEESGPIFWLAGPIGAVAFYSIKYLKYRNTDKRHAYEYKTSSEIGTVTGSEQKIGEVKGVQNPEIPNENTSEPRRRLGDQSLFFESWRQGATPETSSTSVTEDGQAGAPNNPFGG